MFFDGFGTPLAINQNHKTLLCMITFDVHKNSLRPFSLTSRIDQKKKEKRRHTTGCRSLFKLEMKFSARATLITVSNVQAYEVKEEMT